MLQLLRLSLLSLVLVTTICIAQEIMFRLHGKLERLFSEPHKPYLVLDSLPALQQHIDQLKPFKLPFPFLMDGQWVLPGVRSGSIRCVPYSSDVLTSISSDGSYMALIKAAKGFFEYAPPSKEIRLMSTDGHTLWIRRGGPVWGLVTNEGIFVGRNPWNEDNLSLWFFNKDGALMGRVHQVFNHGTPRTGHLLDVPGERMVLAMESLQLVAVEYGGRIRWRHSIPFRNPQDYILAYGIDRLGRGVYITTTNNEGTTSTYILDYAKGEKGQTLWNNERWPGRSNNNGRPGLTGIFDPAGEYAALVDTEQFGIFDLRKNQLLFMNNSSSGFTRPDGVKGLVTDPGATALSSSPLFLVVQLSYGPGTTIFNAAGKKVWSCDIRIRGTYLLSPDGTKLAVLAGYGDPLKINAVFLYQVTAGNEG